MALRIYTLFCILLFTLGSSPSAMAQNEYAEDWTEEDASLSYHDFRKFNFRSPFFKTSLGLYATTLPQTNYPLWGGGAYISTTLSHNLSLGLDLNAHYGKVKHDFNFVNYDPQLTLFAFSGFAEYGMFVYGNFSSALRLTAGYASATLADASQREIYFWTDEYGIEHQGERALVLAKNNMARLSPSLQMRYRLGRKVSIDGAAGYLFHLGDLNFGNRQDFNTYMLQLGIQFHFVN